MADVFLSYGRATRPRVEQISDALTGSGYDLWWDKALNASDDYAMVIEKEIDAARCVVVAWSAQARQSLWVRAEANEALDAGKLVQINLDACRLPLPFTMLHFLDFRPWRGEREGTPWTEFDGRVGGMLRGEAIDDAAVPQAGPLQGFGKIALLGWAAILLAALTALAVAMVATGQLAPATFSALTLAALALAAIMMALAAFVLIRISLASRR